MENVVSNFESTEISIKLTDEKLYIRTLTTSETFALRSVNGVGIVDLVEKYNEELTVFKNKKNSPTFFFFLGGLTAFIGLVSISISVGITFILLAGGGLFIYLGSNINVIEPTLKSAVRIMISGNNRDFEFDKSGSNSSKIAELIVKVEETLTAYHKNNK